MSPHTLILSYTRWRVSVAQQSELLLRDWLIANPDVATAYETLKETLARRHPSGMPAYTSIGASADRAVASGFGSGAIFES